MRIYSLERFPSCSPPLPTMSVGFLYHRVSRAQASDNNQQIYTVNMLCEKPAAKTENFKPQIRSSVNKMGVSIL